MTAKQPLLVVTGPTASGKTALSIRLAKALDGEVVSADSMQMYRGMDIGTAKPTREEMEGVPHHLIDVLEPSETFSVADYAALARPLILEIGRRGRLPILTGGTGLYIQAITQNIQFSPIPSDEGLRQELRQLAQREGNEALFSILRDCDPESAASIHPNNLGRVIRAIEVFRLTGVPISEHNRRSRAVPCPYRLCMLGLGYQERQLSVTAAQAIGYKELRGYLAGRESLAEAVERLKQESRNYAKRQLTWFRREEAIRWLFADAFPDGEALFQEALATARRELYDDTPGGAL